jgi:hypothetical protein
MFFLLFPILALSLSSFAQDFSFLSEHGPQTSFEVEQVFAPTKNLESKGDESKVHFSNLQMSHTVKDGKSAVIIGARFQKLNLSGHDPILNDYSNIQGSLGYRRGMENGNFWFLSGSYGSASDKPFRNSLDGTLAFNYIQKFSPRWFGIINYSNNRTFLNNIPLPGFFWVKEMTREKALILGFPFIYFMNPISENWSIRYIGFIPWNHRLRLVYRKFNTIRPYITFEQAPLSYFRHDREDVDQRFFWFERRAALGVEGGLSKNLRYDLMSGFAFGRQFYEAENFNDTKSYLLNLEAGFFIAINLKYSI